MDGTGILLEKARQLFLVQQPCIRPSHVAPAAELVEAICDSTNRLGLHLVPRFVRVRPGINQRRIRFEHIWLYYLRRADLRHTGGVSTHAIEVVVRDVAKDALTLSGSGRGYDGRLLLLQPRECLMAALGNLASQGGRCDQRLEKAGGGWWPRPGPVVARIVQVYVN